MAVSGSLCALLDQSIDYAGMFPPCGLALDPALRNQSEYVRSPEAWMPTKFVLPLEQSNKTKQLLSECGPSHPLRVCVLGPKTTKADAFLDGLHNAETTIRSFSRYDTDLLSIGHLEMFLPEDVDSTCLKEARASIGKLPVFWEAPPERAEEAIRLLAGHNSGEDIATFGYKLRTGGVTADAFPASAQIALALVMSAKNQLPIKFTAGLHHPIREFRGEVKTKMHGFLNVLGAAVLAAEHQWDVDQAAMMLEEEDPRSFSFTNDSFAWRDWKIGVERLQYR